jgi:hypothetical protein
MKGQEWLKSYHARKEAESSTRHEPEISSPAERLPNELWQMITQSMPLSDRCALSLSCHRFQRLLPQDLLKSLFLPNERIERLKFLFRIYKSCQGNTFVKVVLSIIQSGEAPLPQRSGCSSSTTTRSHMRSSRKLCVNFIMVQVQVPWSRSVFMPMLSLWITRGGLLGLCSSIFMALCFSK